jgi:hypothetical protein
MLLSISTMNEPATDLGYLLHKNPARCQEFEMTFGKAYVFFPEAAEQRCTATLLLDVDPVAMVRDGHRVRPQRPQGRPQGPSIINIVLDGEGIQAYGLGMAWKLRLR